MIRRHQTRRQRRQRQKQQQKQQRRGKTRRAYKGGQITDPAKQREFVDLTVEALASPSGKSVVTDAYLAEAMGYIKALRGTQYAVSTAVENTIETEFIARSISEPVKTPVGYNESAAKTFLEGIQTQTDPHIDYTIHKTPERTLRNAMYYMSEKGKTSTNLFKKLSIGQTMQMIDRMENAPFRPSANVRPDMPVGAHFWLINGNDLINNVVDIWMPTSSPEKKNQAFEHINDVYLTDWVDKIGWKDHKSGQMLYQIPPYDITDYLAHMSDLVKKYLDMSKESGDSQRKLILGALLKKIQKRISNLMQERLKRLQQK